ncbi:hypothetical protein GUJ93_ZPchr0003g17562 [Zizania palustris]|uniref:Uncharacterized protein n=1 Tax=Zizania palustris TaxID=103762 RepID=A0A8J5V6I3_ZIZPA|nr:hypothetical protein GUJ93_ZPchr0003g17562 [Zizania palustris]
MHDSGGDETERRSDEPRRGRNAAAACSCACDRAALVCSSRLGFCGGLDGRGLNEGETRLARGGGGAGRVGRRRRTRGRVRRFSARLLSGSRPLGLFGGVWRPARARVWNVGASPSRLDGYWFGEGGREMGIALPLPGAS